MFEELPAFVEALLVKLEYELYVEGGIDEDEVEGQEVAADVDHPP